MQYVPNRIFGGLGVDSLKGGEGSDVIVPMGSNSTLDGGYGWDIYVIGDVTNTVIQDPSGQDIIILRGWDETPSITTFGDFVRIADSHRILDVDRIHRNALTKNQIILFGISEDEYSDIFNSEHLISSNIFNLPSRKGAAKYRSTSVETENEEQLFMLCVDGQAEIDVFNADGDELIPREQFSNYQGDKTVRESFAYYYGTNNSTDGSYAMLYLLNDGFSIKITSSSTVSAQLYKFNDLLCEPLAMYSITDVDLHDGKAWVWVRRGCSPFT